MEPENHDLGDFGSDLGDFGNDLGPDLPLHGPVEEQLETPTAAAEEEQAATRRSTRLNRHNVVEDKPLNGAKIEILSSKKF